MDKDKLFNIMVIYNGSGYDNEHFNCGEVMGDEMEEMLWTFTSMEILISEACEELNVKREYTQDYYSISA